MIYYAVMTRKTYNHSPYWYAKKHGAARGFACDTASDTAYASARGAGRGAGRSAAYSQNKTYVEQYVEYCTRGGRNGEKYLYDFNPLLVSIYAMIDIGLAVKREVDIWRDPAERDRMKRELMRDLRAIRRPFYYMRETERRRSLAIARRKISRRSTTAPMPTPEEILAAWNARKTSREAMIRLGGIIHDLECYVDNCLRFDSKGDVVGRNGGIRGWLKENMPELSPKYKTLMRYKALAMRLRQATNTKDPTPTSELLNRKNRHETVKKLLSEPEPVFSRLFNELERMLSPESVFLDAPKRIKRTKKRAEKRTRLRRRS
jgi:hypothetical protein